MGKAVWQDCKGAMVLSGAYDEAVKMMGDTGFLTALQNFHKEGITDETVELLKPYFSAPDFNYESAKKVQDMLEHMYTQSRLLHSVLKCTNGAHVIASGGSAAAAFAAGDKRRPQASGNVAGLCNWAAAMCTYHEVAKVVEPKIVALRGAEAKLKVAMREKGAALDELAIVQGRLDEMQACALQPAAAGTAVFLLLGELLINSQHRLPAVHIWRGSGRLLTPCLMHHMLANVCACAHDVANSACARTGAL